MLKTMLAGLVLGALITAPASAQSVKSGIEAWQQGGHERAVAIWRPLAEAGDADASFNIGQAYRLGRGVETNLGAAQVWLERAARKDHVDAQSTLGLLLFQNGNLQGGLRWLKRAADSGEPRAMLVYGTALFNGDGVERDPVLAYAMVSRAAAQGLAAAKQTLAEMDRTLPLAQRKQGVALALEKARPSESGPKQSSEKPKAQADRDKAKRPPSPPAPAAPAAPAAAGGWRIQLGAFSSKASAEALFKRLQASAPMSGRSLFLQPAGAVTRLQVGPFADRAAAAAACKTLAAKGQACFPVRAN